uniref:Uncharacterized protein n=1 Tax=Arundo donax TaxID=35708 RepID=A0A0A9G776_ARUDO
MLALHITADANATSVCELEFTIQKLCKLQGSNWYSKWEREDSSLLNINKVPRVGAITHSSCVI